MAALVPAPGKAVALSRAGAGALPPLRPGDPLGLGLPRPAPAADPDAFDLAEEEASGGRSLADEKLREVVRDHGFMPLADVRKLIATNTVKDSLCAGNIDPELLIEIDALIDYHIYIADGHAYSYEELMANFAFAEMGADPKAFFEAQEVGVFVAADGERSFVARDASDRGSEFRRAEEMVGQFGGRSVEAFRFERVVHTKVWIGRDRWQDFLGLHRAYRAAIRIEVARQAAIGAPPATRGAWPLAIGGPPAAAAVAAVEMEAAPAEAPGETPAAAEAAPAAGPTPAVREFALKAIAAAERQLAAGAAADLAQALAAALAALRALVEGKAPAAT